MRLAESIVTGLSVTGVLPPVSPVIGGEGGQKLNYRCTQMRRTGVEL